MVNRLFGLVGRHIDYSFSRQYFSDKFKSLQLEDHQYVNFDLEQINEIQKVLSDNQKNLIGMNVTIPYKEEIIPFLDELDKDAKEIGAVNTVKILSNGKLKGFNTDIYGFESALRPMLNSTITDALILGTGGAAKAVAFVLNKLNIKFQYVSRTSSHHTITYKDCNEAILQKHLLIINCTPLGTFPDIEKCPELDYNNLTDKHILFDLIYNPAKTAFLLKGEAQGARICNGEKMLIGQAEKAWQIWNQ